MNQTVPILKMQLHIRVVNSGSQSYGLILVWDKSFYVYLTTLHNLLPRMNVNAEHLIIQTTPLMMDKV
ncbi:hypothetical protein Cal6303_3582 [Calothrix sp. PCC 6303]|nr:hypothetical protein Cal6303_3582 [Calothrix sp. PCC 6303]